MRPAGGTGSAKTDNAFDAETAMEVAMGMALSTEAASSLLADSFEYSTISANQYRLD